MSKRRKAFIPDFSKSQPPKKGVKPELAASKPVKPPQAHIKPQSIPVKAGGARGV